MMSAKEARKIAKEAEKEATMALQSMIEREIERFAKKGFTEYILATSDLVNMTRDLSMTVPRALRVKALLPEDETTEMSSSETIKHYLDGKLIDFLCNLLYNGYSLKIKDCGTDYVWIKIEW